MRKLYFFSALFGLIWLGLYLGSYGVLVQSKPPGEVSVTSNDGQFTFTIPNAQRCTYLTAMGPRSVHHWLADGVEGCPHVRRFSQ
jgi:hypothetical protein